MGLKTRIQNIFRKSVIIEPGAEEVLRAVYSLMATPGQPVYNKVSFASVIAEGYKAAIPVYRGIRALVQTGSGIPWVVIKNGEVDPEHHFTKTWAKPNPEFSGQDNMEFLIGHLALIGNSYLRPIRDSQMIPQEYWIELPHQIAPIPSKDRTKWIDGYEFNINGRKQTLPPEAFIHFKQFDPGNLYIGMGAVEVAGRVIDTYNESVDTRKVTLQNRGAKTGIFKPKELMSPELADKTFQRIKELFYSKSKRGEPWLLPNDLDFIDTSTTPVELDYNQSELQLIMQIAAAIGIDPWWLGLRQHSSYNNVKEARKSLYEDAVIPILDDIKATLNLKVAPLYGDIEITYDTSNVAALREDFGQKVTQAQTLWNMGVPFEQINDKLEMGFEEFDNWDVGYLPFSAQPVRVTREKSFKSLTEEQKYQEWKRIDIQREAWFQVLTTRFESLYLEMGKKISKSLKGKINERSADIIIDGLKDNFEETLTASMMAVIEDFSTKPKSKDLPSLFSRVLMNWIKNHAAESVLTILETQKGEMRDLIAKALEQENTISSITKSISKFYSDNALFFAERVARTETSTAAGKGQFVAAQAQGARYKAWMSARDGRVREEHAILDSDSHYQHIPIDQPYPNGMDHVGDPSGGPENIINCRCIDHYYWD